MPRRRRSKLIDSKAEGERASCWRKPKPSASADRRADAERMASEAAILKQNPLLINKIVAERLSDKLQIMMVPADASFSSPTTCCAAWAHRPRKPGGRRGRRWKTSAIDAVRVA